MTKKFPNTNVTIHCIKNDFFGPRITVAGLITGGDIIKQLKGAFSEEDPILLIPSNMLKREEAVFLDDISLPDLEEALQARVYTVKSSGQDLLDMIRSL